MNRFFVTPAAFGPQGTVDLAAHAHQLHAVLRLKAGARVLLLDGSGDECLAELTEVGARRAAGRVLERRACAAEPRLRLSLFQCTLKADKFEWVLQKGTELGVARFVPVISRRSVVRPAQALLPKYERWQAIVREAAEQSGRARLPEIAPPLEWDAALAAGAGRRLLAWEQAGGAAPGASLAAERAVSLLVGPEGGLEAGEVAAAQGAGWQVVTLGPRILRAETAAIAGVAALTAAAGEWGDWLNAPGEICPSEGSAV
jgi:16S rRNA (uracil1498-N3)-methyltransferase